MGNGTFNLEYFLAYAHKAGMNSGAGLYWGAPIGGPRRAKRGVIMSASLTSSWWQVSQNVKNIARNCHISNPTDPASAAFLAQIKVFLSFIWNTETQTGTRPWLQDKFQRLSVAGNDQYEADVTVEPVCVLVKMLEVVGRDLKKIPVTDAEVVQANILIALAHNRQYGTGPYFGSVAGNSLAE